MIRPDKRRELINISAEAPFAATSDSFAPDYRAQLGPAQPNLAKGESKHTAEKGGERKREKESLALRAE